MIRIYAFVLSLLLLPAVVKAQSITIDQGYMSVGVNGTVQYTATVTGLTDKTVTWSVNGTAAKSGTISASGLYTAPAAVPTNGVVITAMASDKKTTALTYVNVAPPGPPITAASPNPATVGSYTLTLTGSGFQPTMVVQANGISLSYTYVNATTVKVMGYQGSVGTVNFAAQVTGSLFGTPLAVPFKSAGASQTVTPSSASVNLGASKQFSSSGATSWTASAGAISAAGLYTAPTSMPASSTVTVTAKGLNGTATAYVTLINATPQIVSPLTATLALGATQQFTSAGATSWSSSAGSIDANGLYTAPATLPSSSSVTITVTGANGIATAVVTLLPPTPVIQSVGSGVLPLGIFNTTITGTGFTSQSVAQLNGTPLATKFANGMLTVSGFYGQSGPANMIVANGAVSSAPYPVQVGVQNAFVSAAAARRFLEQAAFGPTPTEAGHVQAVGIPAWLQEQFNLPSISTYNGVSTNQGGMPAHFLTMAVSNQDQLRQRVAFALSQVFVTSLNKLIWNQNMITFQNMLLDDAFTNYRKIMADVTLSPAMGQYLDMANNARANPATGSLANENYAREIMQLFTLGNVMLNPDGTTQYDSDNLPIPTYHQDDIAEFARVYTGWTYAPNPGQPVIWNNYISANGNLVPYPAEHDPGSKKLLNGYVSPMGATPQQDLDNALDNIFNHPNIAPFVAKLLIRHLVKSNPSPAYVGRVAAAFIDSDDGTGKHVRGDMKAVITAVLTDQEARANDNGNQDQIDDGHLQEPALYIAGMVRALGGQMNDQNYYPSDLANLGQDIFSSPSVFNYYAPDYQVPGTSLAGGEFQIYSPNQAILRANLAASLMFSQYSNYVQTLGPGTSVDFTAFVPLAATPSTLVDALDLTLTHGLMPAAMKSQIVSSVTADKSSGSLHQVQTAAYLILSSNFYNVWH